MRNLFAATVCLSLVVCVPGPWATPAAAKQRPCTEAEAQHAEMQAVTLRSWDDLYKSYTLYRHCDDGAIAEGYSESVARILVDHWDTLPRLGELEHSDAGFGSFVLSHIDATLTHDDIEKIKTNAKARCPSGLRLTCKELLAQASDGNPLRSASGSAQGNDASSLSCWAAQMFKSRKAKTPVFRSVRGFAYGDTTAEAATDTEHAHLCSNRVRLFYSQDGHNYKRVYETRRERNGVGIRLLGWSEDGEKLLIQLEEYPYDSDAMTVRTALVFEPASEQVKDLHLVQALQRVFGKECEFDQTVMGWKSLDSILVRITRTPHTDHYKQVFCVSSPTLYTFSLRTKSVSRSR